MKDILHKSKKKKTLQYNYTLDSFYQYMFEIMFINRGLAG